MHSLWILEELAAQHRLDMNRTVQRRRAVTSARPTRRNVGSGWLATQAFKRGGGLFATRHNGETPQPAMPRLLQNRQAAR